MLPPPGQRQPDARYIYSHILTKAQTDRTTRGSEIDSVGEKGPEKARDWPKITKQVSGPAERPVVAL